MNQTEKRYPPRLAERFFYWYCDDPLKEEIAGDMEERFWDHYEELGASKAKRKYWLNVLKFIKWHTLKRRNSNRYTQNNLTMVKNNFKVAFRNIQRHKVYSFINISGLTVGITSFILIMLYVQHQLSFDQFHVKKDRIFRITEGGDAITPNIIAPEIERSFVDEVEHSIRVYDQSGQVITIDGESYTERVYYVDPGFFSLFTFPLIQGDASSALTETKSIVLSQKAALRYFGSTDVLGKTFDLEGKLHKVTGVMSNVPANSYFQFDFVAIFSDLGWTKRETWSNWNYHTFIGLKKNVDPVSFEGKMAEKLKASQVEWGDDEPLDYMMESLNDIYLQKRFNLEYEMEKVGNIKYVYTFSGVALLILLIACINYVNLATSKSLDRAKEVGIRKVVGALRTQLIWQFLSESFLFAFAAAAGSFALAYALLPNFNELTGESISQSQMLMPSFIGSLFGLVVFISLLAGFYPAIMLSMFKPVVVLKGKFSRSGTGSKLRKLLVVVQFVISVFMVVATLVVKKQLNYINSKDTGMNREQVVYFYSDSDLNKNYSVFQNKLLANPNIESVSKASHIPTNIGSAHGIQTGETENDWELIYFMSAEKEFMDLVGMEMVEGLSLKERAVPYAELDSAGKNPTYIINETTARLMGWTPDEAIGKSVIISGYEGPVQGVVKDFHFKSLHQPIEPFVLMANPRRNNLVFAKVKEENVAETLSFIETQIGELAPELPFEYTFLDDHYDQMYTFENRLGMVFFTFTSIAIAIACLGIFGLISFMAVNRAKEMGIRKVLGASVIRIVVLLSADFMKLIFIALVLALPLAYHFMNDWLTNYAYQIDLGADVAIIAILFAVLITAITIAYQAIRTATVNPSRVLRNE